VHNFALTFELVAISGERNLVAVLEHSIASEIPAKYHIFAVATMRVP
jgi:hypothetical protein